MPQLLINNCDVFVAYFVAIFFFQIERKIISISVWLFFGVLFWTNEEKKNSNNNWLLSIKSMNFNFNSLLIYWNVNEIKNCVIYKWLFPNKFLLLQFDWLILFYFESFGAAFREPINCLSDILFRNRIVEREKKNRVVTP